MTSLRLGIPESSCREKSRVAGLQPLQSVVTSDNKQHSFLFNMPDASPAETAKYLLVQRC